MFLFSVVRLDFRLTFCLNFDGSVVKLVTFGWLSVSKVP